MAKPYISLELRAATMQRASYHCEYCKSQDKYLQTAFTIDHIVPESLEGTSDFDNLAYACFLCNRLKSNKIKVFDDLTDKWVALFNPRKDIWQAHFTWNNDSTKIIGISNIGRCTVQALKLNRIKLVEYRQCIIPFGTHPPEN
jgi:hypothetical protein